MTNEIYELIVCPWTPGHPRHDHQLIFPMQDGRLMLVWCAYYVNRPSLILRTPYAEGGTGDSAPCRIAAKVSEDRGRSWSDTFTLQKDIGKLNVKHPNLLRLPSDEILFTFTVRNSRTDLGIYMKRSQDECETWSEPVRISSLPGVNFANNDHIVQLSSGRILVPCHQGPFEGQGDHHQALCYYSDDSGRTWMPSDRKMDLPARGAEEPSIVELRDGSLLAVMRTYVGEVYQAHSHDSGENWTTPESTGLPAPAAPPLVKRIPATGDLLLVWNNARPVNGIHRPRNPLTTAISTDEGETWENVRDIENWSGYSSAYAAVTFVEDEALVTYYQRSESMSRDTWIKLKIYPIDWFYE